MRGWIWSLEWVAAVWVVSLAAVLAQAPAGDVDGAVAALRQAGNDVGQQAAAIEVLRGLGSPAVAALAKELGQAEAQTRANAAFALGRLRAPAAVEALLARLAAETDPEVCACLAEALGRIGDARAVPVLMARASRAEATEMDRRGVAVALGALRAAEGVPLLLKWVDSENWEERWRAAVALGQVGDPKTRAWVEARVRDPHPVVAGCAAWASETLAGVPGFSVLNQNLRSGDGGVVYGSAWALGVIGTPAAVKTLQAAAKDGPATAQDACRLVLTWLGSGAAAAPPAAPVAARPVVVPPPAAPIATKPVVVPPPATDPTPAAEVPLDLTERWTDRYGKLEIQATRPVVISHRAAAPDLGAHARPQIFSLPSGDLLLVVDPDPEVKGSPLAVRRSRDQGRTWQDEPTLVRRPNAVAALRNRSVLVYDEWLFAQDGGRFGADLCVSRDGGRAFGPLLLAEFALAADAQVRSPPKEVVEAYTASSAQGSSKASSGFSGRVVEMADGTLVACGLTRHAGDPSEGGVCYRSEDRGLTWQAGATLADQDVSGVALAATPHPGRLVALLAVGTSPVLHSAFSADGGVTWSAPRSLGLPGAGVALYPLGNGVLAAAFGGPGITLMFSLDGTGKGWTDKVLLVDPAEGLSGRAALGAVGRDRVLVVYDRQGVIPELGAAPTAALFGGAVTVTPVGR